MSKNGYSDSLFPQTGRCHICGKAGTLVRHEVFFGPFRQKCKRLGLWVSICPRCHERVHAHIDDTDLQLKREAQRAAMIAYGCSVVDFIRELGKNYLP